MTYEEKTKEIYKYLQSRGIAGPSQIESVLNAAIELTKIANEF